MAISEKELTYPRRAKEIAHDLLDYRNILLESAKWENIPDRSHLSKYVCHRLEKTLSELKDLLDYMEFDDVN